MESDNKKFCTLYLVRHGETEWNKKGIVMGQKDSPLTPEGIEQAQVIAGEFRHVNFDAVFASDLSRAKRTAEIIKLERELAVTTSKLLRERSSGHYEGEPVAGYREAIQHLLEQRQQLSEEEKWKLKLDEDVESDAEVASRIITHLREIAVSHPNKTVLVVTHGGCIRSFLTHVGYAKYGELPSGSFKNAGYVKVLSDGIDFFVKEVKGAEKKTTNPEF